MTATVDYFANDEDNQTDWTDWWTAMSSNEAVITTGWSEHTKLTILEVMENIPKDTLEILIS